MPPGPWTMDWISWNLADKVRTIVFGMIAIVNKNGNS